MRTFQIFRIFRLVSIARGRRTNSAVLLQSLWFDEPLRWIFLVPLM